MSNTASSDVIADRFGRRFNNLRVSLTAACNYACTYCVPNGKRLQAAAYELSAREMIRAVTLLQQTTGISKVRITGGEPLLSPKFGDLLQGVMGLGLKDVSLTTNGQLLPRWSDAIIASGMSRINISLDTLEANKFRDIARSGDLATVLNGIDRMLEGGLRVKVNMVPMRRVNESQIVPMLEYCRERGIELRFIELMNMGHLRSSNMYQQQFFSMEEILELISKQYTFSRTDAPFDSTAVRFEIVGGGYFGVIANESEPFCRTCTRLRLSSNGQLYGCLSNAKSHDIRPLLEQSDEQAYTAMREILGQALQDKQDLSFKGETTVMKFIGG